jgi:methylenetetrahydrofolate dehydrogenase (NADP+) / methenyltetrahydrofolate cyclohydrolase
LFLKGIIIKFIKPKVYKVNLMKLLYGKPIADEILKSIKDGISLSDARPGLAVILVGSDEASKIYVSLKEKAAKEIGMNFFRYDIAEDSSQDEVLNLIEKLNQDGKVHGIIVQLPLPEKFDTEKIISKIDPKKDADGFSAAGGSVSGGYSDLHPVFPRAIMLLVQSSGEKLEGKRAVVIANSDEFGKTMVEMLEQKGAAAEYLLSQNIGQNAGKISEADILVSAVGSKGMIRGEMLKNGAIVADGGIVKISTRIWGDVDLASTREKIGFLTPVPGGVGPVTIACLLENVFLAFKAQIREK